MNAPARNLLDVARRISTATIFQSQFRPPEEFPTVEAAAARIRELAGPGPLTIVEGAAAYPDFDPFLDLVIRKDGASVCYFADRWADPQDRRLAAGQLAKLLA